MRWRGICAVMATGAAACSSSAPRPGFATPDPVAGEGVDAATPAAPPDAATDAATAPSDVDAGAPDAAPDADDGTAVLFGGVLTSDWRMSTIKNQPGRDDPGHFAVEDGALVAHPGTDLGLFWNARPMPPSFVLALEFRLSAIDDNSGVFVRFPDPESKGYDNSAWVAINFGFEVQINEPGVPDGAPDHTTGAIYAQPDQAFTRVVANPPGAWNSYEIRVEGDTYTVTLNGRQVTRYVNTIAGRGLASAPGAPALVGLQTHTGNVAFRNIRIRPTSP